MKKVQGSSILPYSFFTMEKVFSSAIIRLHECPFYYGTDLKAKENFLRCFDNIAKDEEIKTILLFGPPEHKGCERFFDECQKVEPYARGNFIFEQLQNAVSQYVMKIAGLNKIVIHIDQRKSIPLFMNIGLACDYRIVCEETTFHTRNLEMGFLPKGGEIFFLHRIIGFKKMMEIFLLGKVISAKEALDMGLVNEIVSFKELKNAAFQAASEMAKKPSYVLSTIKRLANSSNEGLYANLEYEKEIFTLLVTSKKFQDRITACSWNGI
ncbi:MAG: enoyl-CoA hydratase/isomerase family protein [Pseudomonadota bacterium]